MRRLRKDGTAHRRFRPRLLIGAVAAAVLLAGLVACVPAKPPTQPSSVSSSFSWYQLQASGFLPLQGPSAGLPVAFRPWTVQNRVADMAFLADTLFCGLNGSGIASLGLDPSGTPTFAYHFDSLIFAHRTITTLFPRQGTLAMHLYYNALLNDAPQQDLTLTGISLGSYIPAKADFGFLIPPFQRKNPDYEAVGFVPVTENQFNFEWKFTDTRETRFAYTRFNAQTMSEEKESRDAFLDSLGVPFIAGAAVPPDLASFFALCKGAMPAPVPGAALQFVLRSRDGSVRRSFRSVKESDAAVVVSVFEDAGARFALLPGGRVLTTSAGAPPRTIDLPALPRGFRYTDLVKSGAFLVVPWEESRFTDVGRAGILLFKLPS
jgi:hypothetical protein